MIRKLKSGEYRLYSKKKTLKPKEKAWEHLNRDQQHKNTNRKFNISKGIKILKTLLKSYKSVAEKVSPCFMSPVS